MKKKKVLFVLQRGAAEQSDITTTQYVIISEDRVSWITDNIQTDKTDRQLFEWSLWDVEMIKQHMLDLNTALNKLTVLHSVPGWHPLPHTHKLTLTLQSYMIQASSHMHLLLSSLWNLQRFVFPRSVDYFHEHVGNQVTAGVLRLLSVITSQFVTCFNI